MFSPGIELALRVAQDAHDGQVRKGAEEVPYFVHPVHVAIVLARVGADDETIQAGILHDIVEDCDDWTLERIETMFSPRVRSIVADLTEDKSFTWVERKQRALDHVEHMHAEAVLVKAADKLHNLESLVDQLERADAGEDVWGHFNGGREGTLRVAEELVEALADRVPQVIRDALIDVLQRLRELASA